MRPPLSKNRRRLPLFFPLICSHVNPPSHLLEPLADSFLFPVPSDAFLEDRSRIVGGGNRWLTVMVPSLQVSFDLLSRRAGTLFFFFFFLGSSWSCFSLRVRVSVTPPRAVVKSPWFFFFREPYASRRQVNSSFPLLSSTPLTFQSALGPSRRFFSLFCFFKGSKVDSFLAVPWFTYS